jgi:hypothetical protein
MNGLLSRSRAFPSLSSVMAPLDAVCSTLQFQRIALSGDGAHRIRSHRMTLQYMRSQTHPCRCLVLFDGTVEYLQATHSWLGLKEEWTQSIWLLDKPNANSYRHSWLKSTIFDLVIVVIFEMYREHIHLFVKTQDNQPDPSRDRRPLSWARLLRLHAIPRCATTFTAR